MSANVISTATGKPLLPTYGVKTFNGVKVISNVTLRSSSTVETLVDASGAVQNPAKTYRVTVNNFMADGADGYATLVKGSTASVVRRTSTR